MNFNWRFWFARQIFLARRAQIYAQIAFALEHDSPTGAEIESMRDLAKRRGSSLYPVYAEWLNELRGRASGRFAGALRTTIPASEYSLLASAEETQTMKEGMRFLSTSVKKVEEMRAAIVGAFKKIWLPFILLLGLFAAVDAYFFPMIAESLPRKAWPLLTTAVASVCANVASLVAGAVIVVPILVAVWFYLLPRWTGAGRVFAERTIFFSKYRDYQCALFLVNLAFLMEAGHPPRDSLERIGKHSNLYIKHHVTLMLRRLNKEATNAGEALVSTGLFSEELGDLMSNYARWSDWATQIRSIADSAIEVVTQDVKALGPKLESFLQLALGLCVMTVFASGAFVTVKVLMTTTAMR